MTSNENTLGGYIGILPYKTKVSNAPGGPNSLFPDTTDHNQTETQFRRTEDIYLNDICTLSS